MGFGLPAAMGVQAAFPGRLVIDIDGDGSFQMNIQELSTLVCEKLPVKVLLLNNQHLGMVVQWEDRFMQGNRAHTYLGPVDHPEWAGQGDGVGRTAREHRYADFVQDRRTATAAAARYVEPQGRPAGRHRRDDRLRRAPTSWTSAVPYQEHVLPMIPSGHTVKDMITE